MQNYPIVKRNTISSETSALMREILETVVSEGGGKNAQVPGFRIGGKTGTAQKYANGVIAQGMYVSTFLGFMPADDPEYILLFIVDEPKGGAYYGSVVAAPYAGEIFSKIVSYKGMQPSSYVEKEKFRMPLLEGLTLTEAVKILKQHNLYYELAGEWTEGAKVAKQLPLANSYVTEDSIILIDVG